MTRSMTLGALALALFAVVATPPVLAQGKKLPAATIAVIDMIVVQRDSKVGKDIFRQLEEYGRQLQAEVTRNGEAFRKEEDELKRQQAVLAADAFEKKRRDFEARAIEVQKQLQVKKQQFDRSTNIANQAIRAQLRTIVDGLRLVL